MILNISVAHRPVGQGYFSPLFDANNFELNLISQKLSQCIDELGGSAEIEVEKLAINNIHVARCCDVKNLSELKTLIHAINDFSGGEFIRLNRAIGAFDNSKIKAKDLIDSVDIIAPIAYDVKDNYIGGVDIREKEKYNYVEVGRGILIGLPK